MNKTIWALAFVVLCSGMAFAITNASTTYETSSKWEGIPAAENITIEGGNVTNVTLDANLSTEKWGGFYGEVDGNLVLAETAASAFMYSWSINESNAGEVCVSTNSNPTWANLASGALASAIDTAWGFVIPSDADTAVKTYDETGSVNIAGTAYTGAAVTDIAPTPWQTVALNVTSPATAKDHFVFCVNITQQNNYVGAPVDFEMMVPTPEASGPGTYEDYFFFVELI